MGLFALSRSPLFRVREVRVEGLTHGSPARIVRLAGLSEQDRTLGLDLDAIRSRVERDPWVARAEIDIDLPSTVIVRITERSPVAWVDLGAGPMLIDGAGVVIAPGTGHGLPEIVPPPGWTERLPLGSVRASSVAAVARALGALPTAVRAEVERAEVLPETGLELILRGGARVRYGPPRSIVAKGEVLAQTLAWAREAGEQIREINVVAPSAPALVLAR
jgi:cell division protein FtsQ